jgi:hypothetical protein
MTAAGSRRRPDVYGEQLKTLAVEIRRLDPTAPG